MLWMLELRLQTHMLRSKPRMGLNMELIFRKKQPYRKNNNLLHAARRLTQPACLACLLGGDQSLLRQ